MEGILTIFFAIFLAELGDKTQLATMAFAARYGWKVAFVGAILGLGAVNLIGALLGDKLSDVVPLEVVHKAAGVLFIVFGVLMLFGKL
ncbi:MAG: TMEM165/GDT1 family protein [Thermococcus sp.]|nr:TMEM165/GDT1 family protein [Thermococcus sp.]